MTAGGGGDGAYNDAGEWTGSGSGNEGHTGNIGGYTSWSDMFDGGGAGTSGVNFEGGIFSNALNSMGVNPYGYTETAATNFETKPGGTSSGSSDTETVSDVTGTSVGGPAGGYSGDYGGAQGDWGGPSFSGADGGISGLNQGGSVQYKKQGGSIWDTERQLEIAMNELPQQQHEASDGGGGKGLLGQAGGIASGMIVKKLLGSFLGGPLALLASEGGSVQYKEQGGSIGQRYPDNQSMWKNPYNGKIDTIDIESGQRTSNRMPAELQSPLGDPALHRENKKTSNSMKVETHTKDEARKDMKFAVEEKRKQELHEKKMRVI